jgi:hypothetical protein
LIMKETLGENNIHFVKDVPVLQVNLIIIVIKVSGKNKRHYFRTDLLIRPTTRRLSPLIYWQSR